MSYTQLGFANRYVNQTWSVIFPTLPAAQRDAQLNAANVDRNNIAVPVFRETPATPPRPSVALIEGGIIVTYRTDTNRWVATYPSTAVYQDASLVTFIRNVPVRDDEIDALQALPALTVAWEAA